ncbi:MAG TPA: peptidoglycan DD-metalloendopeptidase family protein, partial [Gaiellaceae bacterium]|nr:peptidoglycan DD-metalloendopeptidase family protein [Gaiellaceae bacterium]
MRATLPAALLAVVALAVAGTAQAGAPGSADVAALQVGLTGLGLYDDDVDGFAGPKTLAALRRVQGATSPLAAETRAALGTFGATQLGSRPLVLGCSGWDVASLQWLLAWHGFPSGQLDGTLGDRTLAALLRFQRWAGLDAVGVAGPQTVAALREPPPVSPIKLVRPIDASPDDGFGPRTNRFHAGVDYPAPLGTTVWAAGEGVVSFTGPAEGFGTLVVVQHSSGVTTFYGHLSKTLVTVGKHVSRGAPIGLVGMTGDATGPHLHFEVRVRDASVDPA